MPDDPLWRELEARVEELGFEVVDLERAGDARRPILRLRIDRPAGAAEESVSLEDCTRVSRALEPHLDARADLSERYVLEVSSPGVERPLVRRSDWDRFAGREVVVRGTGPLAGRSTRLEGTLLGLAADADEIRLRLGDGEEVRVPLGEVKRANLVFRWNKRGRSG